VLAALLVVLEGEQPVAEELGGGGAGGDAGEVVPGGEGENGEGDREHGILR